MLSLLIAVMDDEQLRDCTEAFLAMDTDNSGELDMKEIQEAFNIDIQKQKRNSIDKIQKSSFITLPT